MAPRPHAPRPSVLAWQGAVAALGVVAAAVAATVVVTIVKSSGGDSPWSGLLGCLRFGAWTALPCAVVVWPLAAIRLRRTRMATVQERCSSVAIWSCVVPFVWAVGFVAFASAAEGEVMPRDISVLVAACAGMVAEMVWLVTLTPVFIYHCTARALRGDPFNGMTASRDGQDERGEDAEVGAPA